MTTSWRCDGARPSESLLCHRHRGQVSEGVCCGVPLPEEALLLLPLLSLQGLLPYQAPSHFIKYNVVRDIERFFIPRLDMNIQSNMVGLVVVVVGGGGGWGGAAA